MKNLQELSLNEMKCVEGGFIPVVIAGVYYSAATVAGWCTGALAGGVALGAAAYLAGR